MFPLVDFSGWGSWGIWQDAGFLNKHNNKQNQVKSHFSFLKVKCISHCDVIVLFRVFGFLRGMLHIYCHQIYPPNKETVKKRQVLQIKHRVFCVDAPTFFLHFVSFLLLFAPIPEMTVIFWNISLVSLAPPHLPPPRLSVSLLLRTTQRDDMLEAHPGWVARLQGRCGWQDQPSTDYGSNACRQCKTSLLEDL